MNIGNEIRKLTVENGVTLTHLAKCIAVKKGKPYSVQNLSSKLKKGTANFNELAIILEELGYDIKFEKTDNKSEVPDFNPALLIYAFINSLTLFL